MRKLTSDELGKKGESRFPELCVDAGLVPNQSTWDRKGWDFIVEWPQHKVAALDSRPTPTSALVQLKTVWNGATSVQARLSSLEHIAKELKPAIIYVLEADDTLSFVGARAIHVSGEFLAFVLMRLRRARKDDKAPNKIKLSIPLERWSERLEPTGPAFRAYVENAVGPSMAAYLQKKQSELSSLGYEAGKFKLTTTFLARDRRHLIDAFLGLEKIEIAESSAVEERFGIEIPIPDISTPSGLVEISPKPRDKCTILARTGDVTIPLCFTANMYGIPKSLMVANELDVLIRAACFDLRMRVDDVNSFQGALTITLKVTPERILGARLKASEWHSFYSFMEALVAGPITLEIKPKKTGVALVGVATSSGFKDTDIAHWRRGTEIMAATSAIFERAGSQGFKIGINEIVGSAEDIGVLDRMFRSPEKLTPLSFQTEKVDHRGGPLEMQMLYVDHIPFGSHAILYAAVVKLTGAVQEGVTHWSGPVDRVVAVSRVKATQSAFDSFVNTARFRTGIENVMAAPLSDSGQPNVPMWKTAGRSDVAPEPSTD